MSGTIFWIFSPALVKVSTVLLASPVYSEAFRGPQCSSRSLSISIHAPPSANDEEASYDRKGDRTQDMRKDESASRQQQERYPRRDDEQHDSYGLSNHVMRLHGAFSGNR